jgi:hypothetical protein
LLIRWGRKVPFRDLNQQQEFANTMLEKTSEPLQLFVIGTVAVDILGGSCVITAIVCGCSFDSALEGAEYQTCIRLPTVAAVDSELLQGYVQNMLASLHLVRDITREVTLQSL